MAEESLYRRKPTYGVEKILGKRSDLLKNAKQTAPGTSMQSYNPCFVSLTGYDKRCNGAGSKKLPDNETTWDSTYGTSKFKPGPDIESATVEYAGDWGLAQKVSATIKCYKLSDFKEIQRYFLMPGNEIDITFGNEESVSWGTHQTVTLTGFTVATFSFSATAEGVWICTFDAVSSSTAIKTLDMQSIICNGCNTSTGDGPSGDAGPLKYITGNDRIQHPVKGVAQLIASDAQQNGKYGIDEMQDGEVITKFENYSPGTTYGKDAAIVVYKGDAFRGTAEKFQAWVGSILKEIGYGKSEVEVSNNQVYVTLGYIVHRIIDDQLLRKLTCQVSHERGKFNKLKVEFHPKFSKSRVPPGLTSGDPTTMLLLGDANYKNVKDEGKNFDADCKYIDAVRSVSITNGSVKLQNILLHRDVIAASLAKATSQRESNADTTDVKNTNEEVINIVNFFNAISDHINACTGGAISLRLVEDPDERTKLIVVDQNYGESDNLPLIVFNPIDGDGSTISCEIQSNVGSQEYRNSMFVGTSKKGDAVTNLRGCSKDQNDERKKQYSKALEDKFALISKPGNLGKNEFDSMDINSLKSIMGTLYQNSKDAVKYETLHYPGLSISVTIDGAFGIIPGNAISSTQVPPEWRKTLNSYFMVTKVTHNFQQSKWTTQIDGILGYYDNLDPVYNL